MNMRLSVIIPIYNVQQWLPRCIKSCLQQGLKADEFEMIAVNDGSTDDSQKVLEQLFKDVDDDATYGGKLSMKIVNQENKGLSAARNAGLKVAGGAYVWFVDSDDFVEPNILPSLLQHAEADRLDVLCFGLNLYYESDGHRENYIIPDASCGETLTGQDFLLKVAMPPAAWAAIYRREFLLEHDLHFLEGALHEDQEYTIRAYFFAERIAFENKAVYNYVQREGSIMLSLNPKKSTDLLLICQILWDFAMQHTQSSTPIRNVFVNRVSFLFSQALSNFCRCGIFTFPGDCKQLPYYPLCINKQLSQKERYKYRLINASVPLYMKLYNKFNGRVENSKLRALRTH